jgi:predicted AAA+ superfamily ATPase
MVVLSNLAQDLHVAPQTAKSWLEVLERMYLVFRVTPYTRSIPRAIQKPPKVYFFDNGDVIGGPGARFENLVATLLLKRLHFIEDYEGYRCELRYIRDKEGREVDFAVFVDGSLEELIEVKYNEETVSRSLVYYTERLKPKRAYQLVAGLDKPYDRGHIRVMNPLQYAAEGGARF